MRRLIKQDVEEIRALRAKRVLLKDIAQRFHVSEAQICNILNGKRIARRLTKEPETPRRSPYDPVDFQEQNFSILPNDVYFKHTKACDFIG